MNNRLAFGFAHKYRFWIMARREKDREDLIAEATALTERFEAVVEGEKEPVVIGFRPNGCGSVFFGPSPVYHFNSQNLLRRA
ncbi:MAG: hypothetical protein N2C14_16240, partial [Planctomycetales bacterium]